MKSYRGKRIVVTGSAGGIGRKLAMRFAREGATVILTDVKEAELHDAEAEIHAAGGAVRAYALDVTRDDAVVAVRDRIHAEVGTIDVLVNNAGVVFGGRFLDVPMARHRLTYGVNAIGLVAMTHAFLPDLTHAPEAQLVNVASASGLIGLPDGATYASSKWAVIGFSESIRLELEQAGHGHVKVTTICPSYIGTGMFEGVKAPLLTPMLTPEALVEKMFQAIAEEELFLLEPAMVKTLPVLKGLLPQRAFDWVAEKFGVSTSMRAWKGHAAGH
jgi:short-subunit dehydrogenase